MTMNTAVSNNKYPILVFLLFCFSLSPRLSFSSVVQDQAQFYDNGLCIVQDTFTFIPIDTFHICVEGWRTLDSLGAVSLTRSFPGADASDTLFTRPDGCVVKLPDLTRCFTVTFGSPVSWSDFETVWSEVDAGALVSPVGVPVSDAIPNDSLFSTQWHMFDDTGASIGAKQAWDFTTGDSSQTLALIDVGVDLNHEDLLGRVIGGIQIDDPSQPWQTPSSQHGTRVVGMMAANSNNTLGVAGINWKAKIYTVTSPSLNFMGKALLHLDTLGIKYVNMSFGFSGAGINPAADGSGGCDATTAYISWIKDGLLVGSKGNDNTSDFHCPSDLSTVIGVGGLLKNRQRIPASNTDNDIRLGAPAVLVPLLNNGSYIVTFAATSWAAPVVTGALSLVSSANSSLYADEIEGILYQTANDTAGPVVGYDVETGHGSVHVGRAVQMAATKRAYRDNSTSATLTLEQAAHTRRFWHNLGYTGGLFNGQYTDVERYRASHTFNYGFGHDSLTAIIRRRCTIGWPLNDHVDSTREIAWAAFDTTSLDRSSVTVYTGVYYIPDNGTNRSNMVGWWPCKNPPCVSAPDIDLAISVLVATTPGDADNNTSFNVADVNYMLAWIFTGGSGPPIRNDADANGDCVLNIADVTYMIANIFNSGSLPLDADCVPGSLKPAAGGESFVFAADVALDVGAKRDNRRMLKYNATRKVNALVIRLKALNGSQIEVTKTSAKSELYWSQTGADVIIGLIDPQGQDFFMPSDSDLVEIAGDFEIVSVEATDIHADGTTEYLRPQYVAGKFTSSSDPTIGEFSFDGAFPNPFNPETQIAFSLPISSNVKIEIYNILGQRVITLTDKRFDAGAHTVSWSSQDESGSIVASGMYFAKMTAGDFSASKKLVILK